MKRITKTVLLTVFSVIFAAALCLFAVNYKTVTAETLSYDTENKITTVSADNMTALFDKWNNANISYTENGVLSTAKNNGKSRNLFNIIAPFSVNGESELNFEISIPLYNENVTDKTNPADSNYNFNNIRIALYNGSAAAAYMLIWGNSYGTAQTVSAEFYVGSEYNKTSATDPAVKGVKIYKGVMWESGSAKFGFSKKYGWKAEQYVNEEKKKEYKPVDMNGTFTEALNKLDFNEITRIQIITDINAWATGNDTKGKVLLKSINGQTLKTDEKGDFTLKDGFFVTDINVKESAFKVDTDYKFGIVNCNPSGGSISGVTHTAIESLALWAKVTVNGSCVYPVGDIGWNADGNKGVCTESGIEIIVRNPDGTKTETKSSNWNGAPFKFRQKGKQTVEINVLSTNGYYSRKSISVVVGEYSVKDVIAAIEEMDVTEKSQVTSVDALYEGLTDEEKTAVTNYRKLSTAKTLSNITEPFKKTFKMIDGASLRITYPIGLRWTATLGEKEYNDLTAAVGEIEFGTVIAPVDLLGDNPLTVDGEYNKLIVERTLWDESEKVKGGEKRFNAAIVEMRENNYARTFRAVAYAKFTVNGEEAIIYAEANDTDRSAKTVAITAMEKENFAEIYTEEERLLIEKIADREIVASEIKRENGQEVFAVNGEPYLMIGAEARFDVYTNCDKKSYAECEKYFAAAKNLGVNALEIPLEWRDLEPRKDEYDYSSIDAYMSFGKKYGIKIQFLWYSAMMCGYSSEYLIPDYIMDGAKKYEMRDKDDEEKTIDYTYDSLVGKRRIIKLDDPWYMERERNIVEKLMQHVYDWETVNKNPTVTIGVQVYNEADAFPYARLSQHKLRYNGKEVSEAEAIATLYTAMENCAAAFKGANYKIVVSTNIRRHSADYLGSGSGNVPMSFIQGVYNLSGIDSVWYDPYLNDITKLKNTIEDYKTTLPENFTCIAENGKTGTQGEGEYLNPDGEILTAVSSNCGYFIYELATPEIVRKNEWNFEQGVLDSVTLDDYAFTNKIRTAFTALKKADKAVATAETNDFAVFNVKGETAWNNTVNTTKIGVTFRTESGAKGFAVVYGDYVYFSSFGAAELQFSNGTFGSAEKGGFVNGTWQTEETTALINNKITLVGGSDVYRVKILTVSGALVSDVENYKR